MSGGMVALKKSPCRFLGSVSRMALSSLAKPIESISSASSSTSTRMPLGSSVCCRRWSSTRPGVPTTICAPASSASICLRHRGAAVDRDDLRPAVLAELLDFARHLQGELARRAERERLHGLDRGTYEAVDDGQAERRGLSRARARLNDQAAPLGGGLEDRALDRRRVTVAHRVDRAAHIGAQRQDVERGLGRRGFRG